MKSIKIILLATLLIMVNVSLSQTTSSCTNSDFESGTPTGWTATEDGTPITTWQLNGGRHTIMNGTGTDPNTLNSIQVVAPGGLYSAKLGNDVGNLLNPGETESLSYTINVTPSNILFIYRYAVVLEDNGHLPNDQPFFSIELKDAAGNIIDPICGKYNVVATSNLPGFQVNGITIYKDWVSVGLNLSAYIGQTLTIEFTTRDCTFGGHSAYAYIDAYCDTLTLNSQYCTGAQHATLLAPAGFTYLWSTGQTTQSIVINNPVMGQSYTCVLTSPTGCTVTLSTVLTIFVPIATFTLNNSCYDNAVFTNTTFTPPNITLTNFLWNFGDGTTSNLKDPIHQYAIPGTYNVTLTATNAEGCSTTSTNAVTVIQTPTAVINYVGSPYCTNLPAVQNVTLTGTGAYTGGVYSSTIGLTINPTTGSINLLSSTPGTYTVTYAIPTTNNCKVTAVTTTVKITPIATANIVYPAASCISSATTQNVTITGTGPYTGGVFTASPNGLSINSSNGDINVDASTAGNYTVNYSLPANSGCPALTATAPVTIYSALPNVVLPNETICVDKNGITFRTAMLSTRLNNTSYSCQWSFNGTPIIGNTTNTQLANQAGIYSVIITDTFSGCFSKPIVCTVSKVISIDNFSISITDTFSDNPTATVVINSGTGPFSYQLDNNGFQDSNVFPNINPGTHTLRVIDDSSCSNVVKSITVFSYPKFFTPNGDGINDSWNLNFVNQKDIKVTVFDRFGNTIKSFSPYNQRWDGKLEGNDLPSDDYWFIISYKEINSQGEAVWTEFKSHFSLKR
jgi:gliding motility-associated-like protein